MTNFMKRRLTMASRPSFFFDRRPRVPAVDRPVGMNRFRMAEDRRGFPLLVAPEPNGTFVAIVPGGTRLPSPSDQRDLPLLWRYARWCDRDEFARDLPPEFIIDMSLAELVDRHQAHAEWMLERSAVQLRGVLDLLDCNTDPVEVCEDFGQASERTLSTLLAYRRGLYVLGEVYAGAMQFAHQTQGGIPRSIEDVMDEAKHVLGPTSIPVAQMEVLIASEGPVTIKRGLRRWHGPARAAVLVFLKLYEAERALAQDHPTHFARNRLRLLEGALNQALRTDSHGGALRPLHKRCVHALEFMPKGAWTERDRRLIHRCLVGESALLRCRRDDPQPPDEDDARDQSRAALTAQRAGTAPFAAAYSSRS